MPNGDSYMRGSVLLHKQVENLEIKYKQLEKENAELQRILDKQVRQIMALKEKLADTILINELQELQGK